VSRYQKGKTRKGKTNLDLLEQEIVSGSGTAGLYASLHLIPDNHANIPPLSFLHAGCPCCRPTNSVKALKAYTIDKTPKNVDGGDVSSNPVSQPAPVFPTQATWQKPKTPSIVLKNVTYIMSGSSKVVDHCINSKLICDLMLLNDSNCGRNMLYCLRDIEAYRADVNHPTLVQRSAWGTR